LNFRFIIVAKDSNIKHCKMGRKRENPCNSASSKEENKSLLVRLSHKHIS
jgi:hypothetical protein